MLIPSIKILRIINDRKAKCELWEESAWNEFKDIIKEIEKEEELKYEMSKLSQRAVLGSLAKHGKKSQNKNIFLVLFNAEYNKYQFMESELSFDEIGKKNIPIL